MAAARPFRSREALDATADIVAASLDRTDWLEAFAAHPRIGERETVANPGEPRTTASAPWSAQEQAGVTDLSRERFIALNREYEARFGYIFIVCATGRSGAEMLDILERRMSNNPHDEFRAAAEQQRQITHVRLAKLIAD
jgi:OHCU decarboxylase